LLQALNHLRGIRTKALYVDTVIGGGNGAGLANGKFLDQAGRRPVQRVAGRVRGFAKILA
jgi:hypothetical protein